MDYWSVVLENFCELLDHRLTNNSVTTEDAVRYTMFHCLTKFANVHPSDIVPESPHPTINRAKIDTVVRAQENRPELVFEFKFDRRSNGGLNKTQRAGAVFADIFRLARYPGTETHRIFIYLTDQDMAIYFRNPYNLFEEFFNLAPNDQWEITKESIGSRPNTFQEKAYPLVDCVVTAILRKDLRGFYLRMYEVTVAPEKVES